MKPTMINSRKTTAIIYDKRGIVLAIANNSYTKSHPYQANLAIKCKMPDKIYLHAEIAAIIKCKDLSKAHRIDIFRFDYDNNLILSKPCKICQSAIDATNIKIITHS